MQKRIMSLLLVFLMIFSSIVTVNASENVPLNISLVKVENFENNKDAVIEWNVKNNSDAVVKANYVTALYEANSNKMISYSYVNDIVNANGTKNYGVCIPIPEQGKYNIKAFAWDNMIAPNLLSNIYELNQQSNKPTDINEIVRDSINKTGKYLVNKVSEPGISSIGGEWTVLALARSGYEVPTDYFTNYYEKVIHKAITENSKESGRWSKKVTDVERVALALTAIGLNPENVEGINLLDYIWDKAGHFPSLNAKQGTLGGRQGSNELIFGLLALDSKNYKQPETVTITREQIIDKLLSGYQVSQGGFALSDTLDLDITAMAIQALAPYYDTNQDVKIAIDKAITVLANSQNADGTFSTDNGVTAETLSQVITALTAININPHTDTRFIKGENTLITSLLKFYVEGGGFKHTLDGEIDGMATEQGMYALVAYNRLVEGKNSLYNMSDVEVDKPSKVNKLQAIDEYFNNKNDYDVFYYTQEEKDSFTLNGDSIKFINENQISYGENTADLRNKEITYSINAGDDDSINPGEEIAITFDQLNTPIGSISGQWNSTFGGEIKSIYNTDIVGLSKVESENDKINNLKFTIPKDAEGEYQLVDGTIFEKANEWSPGIEGIGTEGFFGRLPIITLNVEQTKAKIGKAQLSIEKRIIGKGDTLSKIQVNIFEGDTAWDIIERTAKQRNINIEYTKQKESEFDSVYIQSIDGDGEFDHGPGSGWMFCVNDTFPDVGVSIKTIADGDVIRLKYVTEYSDCTKSLIDILKRYIKDTSEFLENEYTRVSYDKLVDAVNNAKVITNDEQYEGLNIGDEKELIINDYISEVLSAIDELEEKQSSQPAETSVPSDFTNDLWLSTNYQILEVGETYKLVSRRVPEIIDDPISNRVAHPPYNYKVIKGNSIEIEDTTESEMTITAKSLGTSIIEVGYDETIAYGKNYGAVSKVNKSYMIVDVVDNKQNNINLDTDINIRPYDTIYFNEGEKVNYTFDVTTDAETVLVTCNGNVITGNDNEFIVPLENRANIIGITGINGDEEKKLYYVIDARKIEINVTNITSPGNDIAVGDEVKVSFKGITMPVYKLATIYNPTWYAPNSPWGASYGTTVRYTNDDLGELISYDNVQYGIADHNAIKFKVTEEKTYNFTNGYIDCEWWGSPLGSERDMKGPGNPNLNAPTLRDEFSIMPDFSIEVISGIPVTEITLDKDEIKLNIGEKEQLNATVKPIDATNKNINFTTSNKDVATVDENGVITAVGKGTATITAKSQVDENITDTCNVIVNTVEVTNIMLNKSTTQLEEKQNSTLTATVVPDNASNKNVIWKSSDEAIAKVNDGVVTGVKAGIVTITATSEDSNISASCKITVIAELPATQEEKESLKDLIDEAKTKNESEYIASSWNQFADKLIKAEEVYSDDKVLIASVKEVEKQLKEAMDGLLKPLGLNVQIQVDNEEPIEETSVQVTTGSNISIILEGLEAPKTSDGKVHELKTIFDSDIPDMGTVESEQAKDDANKLTKIEFEIPDVEPGIYTLTNGRVYKKWGGTFIQGMWFEQPNREYFYKGQIPNITIEVIK